MLVPAFSTDTSSVKAYSQIYCDLSSNTGKISHHRWYCVATFGTWPDKAAKKSEVDLSNLEKADNGSRLRIDGPGGDEYHCDC